MSVALDGLSYRGWALSAPQRPADGECVLLVTSPSAHVQFRVERPSLEQALERAIELVREFETLQAAVTGAASGDGLGARADRRPAGVRGRGAGARVAPQRPPSPESPVA